MNNWLKWGLVAAGTWIAYRVYENYAPITATPDNSVEASNGNTTVNTLAENVSVISNGNRSAVVATNRYTPGAPNLPSRTTVRSNSSSFSANSGTGPGTGYRYGS